MTPTLRKTHRLIWMILPLLFPLFFWAAITQKPSSVVEENNYAAIPAAIGTIQKTTKLDDFIINLRQADSGAAQVEIVLKKPLSQPSAVVVLTSDTEETQPQVLGELGAQAIYRFALPPSVAAASSQQLQILDMLHQQELASVNW